MSANHKSSLGKLLYLNLNNVLARIPHTRQPAPRPHGDVRYVHPPPQCDVRLEDPAIFFLCNAKLAPLLGRCCLLALRRLRLPARSARIHPAPAGATATAAAARRAGEKRQPPAGSCAAAALGRPLGVSGARRPGAPGCFSGSADQRISGSAGWGQRVQRISGSAAENIYSKYK